MEGRTKTEVALIYPFLALAIAGSVATLVVHVSALLGITIPFDRSLKFLGPVAFVVFLPMTFVMYRLTREFKQKDGWRAALRGCPQWIRRALWIICAYAWIGLSHCTFSTVVEWIRRRIALAPCRHYS